MGFLVLDGGCRTGSTVLRKYLAHQKAENELNIFYECKYFFVYFVLVVLLINSWASLEIHLVIPERRNDLGAVLNGPIIVNEHLLDLEVNIVVRIGFTIFPILLSILEEANHIVENVYEFLRDNYADQLLLEIAFN